MILTRYLVRQLSAMTLLALAAFLALFALIDVIGELDNLGKGRYGLTTLLGYMLLQIPVHAYELMPLAVLIGAMIAMSQLAHHSEYTVMKTSGLSAMQIIRMVLGFGLIFALLTAALGQWAAPWAAQAAQQFKRTALQEKVALTGAGIWFKSGDDFISVSEMLPDGTLNGLSAYRHDPDFHLTQTLSAQSGQFIGARTWRLHGVQQTLIFSDHTESRQNGTLDIQSDINPQLLNVLMVEPESMSLPALGQYVRHLRDNHQDTIRYEVAWWRKLAYPLVTMAMGLIALAFTPQERRRGNQGLRLFLGMGLGVAFHFANRFFGYTSQLYHVPSFLAAFLPTFILLAVAVVFLRKQEKR